MMLLITSLLVLGYTQSVLCTAILTLPEVFNCDDQAVLTCTSDGCNVAYNFLKNGSPIVNKGGAVNPSYVNKYSGNATSNHQVQMTIRNIELSDTGNYSCFCNFNPSSPEQTLQYHCAGSTSSPSVTTKKQLSIAVDRLYPNPSKITTGLTSPKKQLQGTYTCWNSSAFVSHFTCTWLSTESLPDGNHTYTLTVIIGTQMATSSGSVKIATPTSPTISNLTTISTNRQVFHGVQDTPLTIQCVSLGGIPAPTLAWYMGNTSTSPLAQSTTSDSVHQSDGTYMVNLTYRFTPNRTDDLTPLLCRVFYPGATTEASADPPHANASLYLDLKPDIPTVSQISEAVSGGSMTLRCTSANNRPAASITWSYMGHTFTPAISSDYDQKSETYTVVSVLQKTVSAEDNRQTATCGVSHKTLSKPLTETINVDVKFGPSNRSTSIYSNPTISAMVNSQIRLNCTSGSSNPASNITWYNRSDVIPNTGVYTHFSGDNNGVITSQILTITTTRYMNGDRIKCEPENGYGSDSTFVDLGILYSPLIQMPTNITAVEGEPDFLLTCSASSNPPANFTWYNGTKVLINGIGTFKNNSFSYVIPRVNRTDTGSYRCQAANTVGSPDSKDIQFYVKHPPTVHVSTTASPPPYTVTCTVKGYPESYIYQDWVQIWPGYGPVATIPFNGTILTLTDVTYERSGLYVCAASNGVAVYGKDVTFAKGNTSIVIKAPPVLTDPSPDGTRVPVAGRLGHNATIKIKYWSNVDGNVVKCYRGVGDSRSSSSRCFVTQTDTEVTLPVHNHMVQENGTLAIIKIHILSQDDMTAYNVVVSNSLQGESVLGITIIPLEMSVSAGQSSVGLIAGVVVGVCVPIMIGVTLFIMWRLRRGTGKHSRTKDARNVAIKSQQSDLVVECAMYASAGEVKSGPSTDDFYSQSQKTDKPQVSSDVYAVVNKQKKDVYENAPGSFKTGKRKVHKETKPANRTAASGLKKNPRTDGLTYADLEFSNNSERSTIHGLDDATLYVQVDFTKAADPLPDSDDEISAKK